ncbi:hypothetical protein GCM10009868_07680 [Terrabacter aerolatus]|uniref:Uncharacterized protein n=1 Tax=Terrabacter aerolatus TaxID=422442 RepID=A0A512D4V6_9MICO|nr:hypothetical protein [Terrabacter aerolatus]GEO31503.1 hypothetical protein TAE01_33130 [Terrabacter aerolatus]
MTLHPVGAPAGAAPRVHASSQHDHESARERSALGLAVLGLLLVGLGAWLPWLTLFNGLEPLPGFRLDGGDLSGLALLAVGLLVVATRLGAGHVLRPLAVVVLAVVVADSLAGARHIADYVADPGPTAALSAPSQGPGAVVMAVGGLVLLGAAVLVPVRRDALPRELVARLVLAAATFVAGWMHLVLTPEHLGESTVLGLGFLAAGVAQVALAVLCLVRRSENALSALVVLDVALLAVWAYAVLVGLPIGDVGHDHVEAGGLVLGHGEPVDLAAAITKVAELTSLGTALVLMRRGPKGSTASASARRA